MMPEERLIERREIHFEGRVQGVGFRYTTCDIARNHPVAGYVKNLPDGRVRLVVEAEPEAIDRFVDVIQRQFRNHIGRTTSQSRPATGEFAGFRIAY